MLLSAVFWGLTHYCVTPVVYQHKSTDFIDWYKRSHRSKTGSKTRPDNEGIDSLINIAWISSVQGSVRNKTHKISHTGNVIPEAKKK